MRRGSWDGFFFFSKIFHKGLLKKRLPGGGLTSHAMIFKLNVTGFRFCG